MTLFLHTFSREELEFRVRRFNVLAMAGALKRLAAAVLGTFIGAAPMNGLSRFFSSLVAVILLYYSNRTGRYQICYMITITMVFKKLHFIIKEEPSAERRSREGFPPNDELPKELYGDFVRLK